MTARDWPMNWSDSSRAGDCSASASCTAHSVVARQSAMRVGRQHQARGIAVQAVDGERQVALLALGRDAGGRAAAHHVDHDDRHLGGHRQADASVISASPGPAVAVSEGTPPYEAPMIMLTEASSSSACSRLPPTG
jgi:hypothetical protein